MFLKVVETEILLTIWEVCKIVVKIKCRKTRNDWVI